MILNFITEKKKQKLPREDVLSDHKKKILIIFIMLNYKEKKEKKKNML